MKKLPTRAWIIAGLLAFTSLSLCAIPASSHHSFAMYDQTQVLSTYAYQVGVNAGYLGKGAAISLFMFPLMAVIVFFMLRFLRREV